MEEVMKIKSYLKMEFVLITIFLSTPLINFDCLAANCNPKAEVHQNKAYSLKNNLKNISEDDLRFLICMTPEKEDKEFLEQEWKKEQKLQVERIADEARKNDETRRKLEQQQIAIQKEKQKRYDSLIDNGDGTITDTKTNLMWASKDNNPQYKKFDDRTSWRDASIHCKNFRGGGFSDWRMPTLDELATLDFTISEQQQSEKRCQVTKIHLTDCYVWASDRSNDFAGYFDFKTGERQSTSPYGGQIYRALPVRNINNIVSTKSQPLGSSKNLASPKISPPSDGIRTLDIEMTKEGYSLQVILKQFEIVNNEIIVTIELKNKSDSKHKPYFPYCNSEVCSEYLPHIKDDKGMLFKTKRLPEIVSHNGTIHDVEELFSEYKYKKNQSNYKYKYIFGLKFLKLDKSGKSVIKYVFPLVSEGATKFTFTLPEILQPGHYRTFAYPSNDCIL